MYRTKVIMDYFKYWFLSNLTYENQIPLTRRIIKIAIVFKLNSELDKTWTYRPWIIVKYYR